MSIKKSIGLLLSVLLVVALVAGCGTTPTPVASATPSASADATVQPSASATPDAPAKTFTIGFANVNDIYPYLVKVREAIKKYAAAEGMNVLVANAAGDLNQQNGQVENFLVQGVNAVITVPADPDGSTSMADQAWAAGVPYLTVCGNINGKQIHVGSENYQAGVMQAEYLASILPQNGKVLYMTEDPVNQEYNDRRDGFMTLFTKRPDLTLLAEQNSKNRLDLGMTVTETWIQAYSQFDAVVAQNDDSALGAIEALKAANRLQGVTVVGLDGSEPALESIAAGELGATAFQDADGQAKALVELCKQIRDGVDPTTLKDVVIPFKVITKDNLAEVQGEIAK